MSERWYVVSWNNLVLSPDCFRDPKGKPMSDRSDFWTSTPDPKESYADRAAALRAMQRYGISTKFAEPKPVSQYVTDTRTVTRTATRNYQPCEADGKENEAK